MRDSLDRANIKYREQLQLGLGSVMRALGRHRFDVDDFQIDQLDVQVPGLSADFDNFRLVQISDIHMGHWISPERLAGVVELVNEQSADVLLLTGDFVSYVFEQVRASLTDSLAAMQARVGKLAVLGNHDHWLGAAAVRQVLQDSGVIELANDVYIVQRERGSLVFAGVDDIIVGADDLGLVLSKLPDDAPALLLAHEPDFADQSAATGRFFMQLSGHSHGGQIVLPGYGPLLRGPHFYRYPIGLYQVENMLQYTNRGIGTHVFRVRINCPPEITVITLHPQSAQINTGTTT